MEGFNKITQEGIDFPRYCLFFVKEIIDSLEEYDIKDEGDELSLEIETIHHPYCYEALDLIARTFRRKGFNVRFPSYRLAIEDGVKYFNYEWKFVKNKNEDDLPF